MSDSDMLSLFLRSSTNCGSKSGLSFGDIVADLSVRSLNFFLVESRGVSQLYRATEHMAKYFFSQRLMMIWNCLFSIIRGQGLLESETDWASSIEWSTSMGMVGK
jgi:hypothetical protein